MRKASHGNAGAGSARRQVIEKARADALDLLVTYGATSSGPVLAASTDSSAIAPLVVGVACESALLPDCDISVAFSL